MFDYVTEKTGAWAKLANAQGHEVVLTEYPGTLLALHRLGLLQGRALAEAELEAGR